MRILNEIPLPKLDVFIWTLNRQFTHKKYQAGGEEEYHQLGEELAKELSLIYSKITVTNRIKDLEKILEK